MSSVTKTNLLSRLPEHVFIKVTKYLNVNKLLDLESSKILDDGSNSVELAFQNIDLFEFDIDATTQPIDSSQATNILYRCGPDLQRFKFVNSDGDDQPTISLITQTPNFMRSLAQHFPRLTGFSESVWKHGLYYVKEYVEYLKSPSNLRELVLNDRIKGSSMVVVRSPLLKSLNIKSVVELEPYITALKADNQVKELIVSTKSPLDELMDLIVRCQQVKLLNIGLVKFDNGRNEEESNWIRIGNIRKLRMIEQCKQLREVRLRMEPTMISTSLAVFDVQLVLSIELYIQCNDNRCLEELKKFENLKRINVEAYEWSQILTTLNDVTAFRNLSRIELTNRSGLDYIESEVIRLLKVRGKTITKMIGFYITDHHQLVSTLRQYCSKLDSIEVILSGNTTKNMSKMMTKSDVSSLNEFKCIDRILLYCDSSKVYNKYMSFKKELGVKNDKLEFQMIYHVTGFTDSRLVWY